MITRTVLAGLLAALIPAGALQAAGTYDPEVPHSTLETPHFLVVFPEGYGHIALRAAAIAEGKLPRMVERYGWSPDGRISIVINDQTDFANGFATILPSKTITIYVTAPTELSGLEDYDDWLDTVVTHELAHIIHLDMAYGLPWVGRLLLGKYVSMNQYTPAWVTEGLAVYEETVSSGSGRGRSSYVDMVLRVAALEDRFPPMDLGYRGYPNWPFSNVAYFVGGRFQLWLAERYGEEALLHYHRAYASDPVPYLSYLPAKLAFGESLETLWSAFAEEIGEDAAHAKAVIEAHGAPGGPGGGLGVTEPERLTRYGGDLVGPRITPDGQWIVFSTSSPADGARLRKIRMDGSGDEVLAEDTFSKAVSFSPDGRALYFQQTEINQRFYSHNSLLRYELATGTFERVELVLEEAGELLAPSGSLRGRDPDISPDGKRMVFVQTPYGSNRLVLAWLESDGVTIHPKELVKAEPDVQLSDPRFSPDGKLIAVSRFKGGRRDVILYDETGQIAREITRDRAQDLDPTWSPDGKWLVFASDRSGIYNLYAFDLHRGELRQLTNLITGAYQPSISPDGSTMVFRGYSADGFDVYRLPFTPERGVVVELLHEPPSERDVTPRRWPPRALLPELPPPAPFTGTELPRELPEGWSLRDYSSLDTLLPFNDNWNLFPSMRANESEVFGSLTHFGSDAMDTQSYILSLTYGTSTDFLGGGAAYFNDQLEPTFGLFGFANAVTYTSALVVEQGLDTPCKFGDEPFDRGSSRFCYGSPDGEYNERRMGAQLSISLPILQRHLIALSYVFERRDALDPLPDGTLESILPRSGDFTRISLGYSYANVRAFPHSISLERGSSFAIALSALSRGLGGDYEEVVLTTEGRYYLSMPWTHRWLRNHVLASRLSLGVSGGPDLAEEFRLGGWAGSSLLTTTTDNFYGLRGFRSGVLRGKGLVSASLEYRAPILRLDRGLNVPGFFGPLVLDVLHLAVFADAGRVFEKIDSSTFDETFADGIALGAGGELRADVALFFNLPLTVVVGYAHPVLVPSNLDPRAQPRSSGPYFQIGSSF